MPRLPKIVLDRLKRKSIVNQHNRQSGIENQFPHPDANLLVAFAEKTLTARERKQVLNHLAQCAECRAVVALTLPAKVDTAQLQHFPAPRRWNAWSTLRWGLLAAALGAVVIVVVLHPFPRRKQEIAARPASVETKQPVKLMAAAHPPVAAEARNAPTATTAREVSRIGKATSAGAVPPASRLAKPAFKPVAAPEGTPEAAIGAEAQAGATAARTKAESVAIAKGLNAGLVGGVSAPARTLSGPLAAVPMGTKSHQAKLSSMAFREAVAGAVAQPTALWTISSGGKVQRSDDGGKTWEEVRVDDKVTFRVIQAMGQDVWAGGSGGALYHSSDGGATWTRADLSSGGNSATETIVAIISSSRDLQNITVRTESGEQWTTGDGGQHWQREP
jgi:hypothetical protein